MSGDPLSRSAAPSSVSLDNSDVVSPVSDVSLVDSLSDSDSPSSLGNSDSSDISSDDSSTSSDDGSAVALSSGRDSSDNDDLSALRDSSSPSLGDSSVEFDNFCTWSLFSSSFFF